MKVIASKILSAGVILVGAFASLSFNPDSSSLGETAISSQGAPATRSEQRPNAGANNSQARPAQQNTVRTRPAQTNSNRARPTSNSAGRTAQRSASQNARTQARVQIPPAHALAPTSDTMKTLEQVSKNDTVPSLPQAPASADANATAASSRREATVVTSDKEVKVLIERVQGTPNNEEIYRVQLANPTEGQTCGPDRDCASGRIRAQYTTDTSMENLARIVEVLSAATEENESEDEGICLDLSPVRRATCIFKAIQKNPGSEPAIRELELFLGLGSSSQWSGETEFMQALAGSGGREVWREFVKAVRKIKNREVRASFEEEGFRQLAEVRQTATQQLYANALNQKLLQYQELKAANDPRAEQVLTEIRLIVGNLRENLDARLNQLANDGRDLRHLSQETMTQVIGNSYQNLNTLLDRYATGNSGSSVVIGNPVSSSPIAGGNPVGGKDFSNFARYLFRENPIVGRDQFGLRTPILDPSITRMQNGGFQINWNGMGAGGSPSTLPQPPISRNSAPTTGRSAAATAVYLPGMHGPMAGHPYQI